MRRYLTSFVLIMAILFSSSISHGQEFVPKDDQAPLRVYVDGISYRVPQEAFIEHNRTFLRADKVEKAFSLQSTGLEKGRLQLRAKNYDMVLPIDKPGGTFNGRLLPMVHYGLVRDGYIYYPLSLVGQKRGYKVDWVGDIRLVNAYRAPGEPGEKWQEVYKSGNFVLYSEDKDLFRFKDQSGRLLIYSGKKCPHEEVLLGEVSRTRYPKVSRDQGLLLGFRDKFYYEFYWDRKLDTKMKDDHKEGLYKLLRTFTLEK